MITDLDPWENLNVTLELATVYGFSTLYVIVPEHVISRAYTDVSGVFVVCLNFLCVY